MAYIQSRGTKNISAYFKVPSHRRRCRTLSHRSVVHPPGFPRGSLVLRGRGSLKNAPQASPNDIAPTIVHSNVAVHWETPRGIQGGYRFHNESVQLSSCSRELSARRALSPATRFSLYANGENPLQCCILCGHLTYPRRACPLSRAHVFSVAVLDYCAVSAQLSG